MGSGYTRAYVRGYERRVQVCFRRCRVGRELGVGQGRRVEGVRVTSSVIRIIVAVVSCYSRTDPGLSFTEPNGSKVEGSGDGRSGGAF